MPAQDRLTIHIRITPSLLKRIKLAALNNDRSLNGEVLAGKVNEASRYPPGEAPDKYLQEATRTAAPLEFLTVARPGCDQSAGHFLLAAAHRPKFFGYFTA